MPQHITVVNYDPEWPSKYVRERDYITEILKENCISIYHIGSTSVPGLAAKPIIDIMAVVRSLEKGRYGCGKVFRDRLRISRRIWNNGQTLSSQRR